MNTAGQFIEDPSFTTLIIRLYLDEYSASILLQTNFIDVKSIAAHRRDRKINQNNWQGY